MNRNFLLAALFFLLVLTGYNQFVVIPRMQKEQQTAEQQLEQAKQDQQKGARPELKTRIADMTRYDVIFLGYPNWWGTIPMPVASFLEQYDFSGKTIVPFVSSGGSGLGRSVDDITRLCPSASIAEGLSVRSSGGSSLSGDMDAWLKKIDMAR